MANNSSENIKTVIDLIAELCKLDPRSKIVMDCLVSDDHGQSAMCRMPIDCLDDNASGLVSLVGYGDSVSKLDPEDQI